MTKKLKTVQELEAKLVEFIESLEPKTQRHINVKLQIKDNLAVLFGDLYWWVS